MSEDERGYLIDRGAIFATAIGIARLKLRAGDVAGALVTLDKASDEAHRLHFDACIAEGHSVEAVELLLGPRERPA